MKKISTTFILLFCLTTAFAQTFKVDTLYKSGPIDNRVNVVILGDGFTAEEMPKFLTEAKKFSHFFLRYEPYHRYKNYFNFMAISTPSQESGVTNPGTAPDKYPEQPVGNKNTFYKATFGSSIHRLVTIDFWTAFNVLSTNFPSYDLVVVLVNTTYYGGSGGTVAVHTLHESANLIGVHEIGHSFAGLNDEYWAGDGYGWEAPNMTLESSPATIRWRNWLNSNGVGIHKHVGSGSASQWHKPTNAACLMEVLNQAFCAVCREATTEKLLSIVQAIDSTEPKADKPIQLNGETSFKLHLLTPEPNSLQVEWKLNSKTIASGKDQIVLKPSDFNGEATLTATVFDSTFISRRDDAKEKRTQTVRWDLLSGVPVAFRIRALDDSICAGTETFLVARGCAGTVKWSTGQTGDTISVSANATTEFTGSCQVAGQPDVLEKTTVTVLPAPIAEADNSGPYLVGETVELTAKGGVSYAWSGPAGFQAQTGTATISNAQAVNAGSYIVTVRDAKGCTANATTTVVIDPVLSAKEPGEWIRVSPNPASDYATITTSLVGRSTIALFDKSGNKMRQVVFQQNTTLDLKGLHGLLLYRLQNNGKEFSGKLLVK